MTLEAWRLWRKIEETNKSFISWSEIREIAPPEAITPGKRTLSRRLLRELIKNKKLTIDGQITQFSVFGINA